jgi:Protein of unknown function (DUF2721)
MPLPNLPLATPSLLFPAISLLMLAYTNRFLGLASVVRNLHANWRSSGEPSLLAQIHNLRRRIVLIRRMQSLGVMSLISCIISMTLLFLEFQIPGQLAFAISLALMLASLSISLAEIQMSGTALDLQLQDVLRGGE